MQANQEPMTSPNNKEKPAAKILDRLEKVLKASSSVYAILAAFAAVLIANQSEARRTRFTLHVISQMWIECIMVVLLWCVYLYIRQLIVKFRKGGVKLNIQSLVKPGTVFLLILSLVVLLAFVPPLAYIVKVRYEFWTHHVLRSYVEAAKYRIDQQANSGRLNTALNTVDIVSEVVKNTPQESRLDYRRRILEVATRRSDLLDKGSLNQWNFVTERSKFFSLVESVRIDPENSSAADRLAQKLNVARSYLAEDANAICNSHGQLTAFAGKAIAGIEARSLWEKHGASDHCVDLVRDDLADGWGISAITCILERSGAIKRDEKVNSNTKTCPEGEDFWTPMPAGSSMGAQESESKYEGVTHPYYPTFLDLWRKLRSHKNSDN